MTMNGKLDENVLLPFYNKFAIEINGYLEKIKWKDVINKYNAPKNLFVFDLDNTLIEFPDNDQDFMFRKSNKMDNKPVNIYNHLKEGITRVICTARPAYLVTMFALLRDLRVSGMIELFDRFPLDKKDEFPKIEENIFLAKKGKVPIDFNVMYRFYIKSLLNYWDCNKVQNIFMTKKFIMSADMNKASAVDFYLKWTKLKPNWLVFIDDNIKNVCDFAKYSAKCDKNILPVFYCARLNELYELKV